MCRITGLCVHDGKPHLTGRLRRTLTLIGAIGVGLIAVVPTVIIPIAGPVIRYASATVTLELSAGAGVTTACFIAVIPTVII